ncbi:MAG TPA: ABC transporter permease [Bryobacteraceae bacterium]|nr:ABC transporter permease [Bryobacteraceae bacterium]
MFRKPWRFMEWLFRLRYGKSAEFVLGDVMEEYTIGGKSRWWVCRQLWSTYGPAPAALSIRKEKQEQMTWPIGNEIRYAARTLSRNPGFAALAIVTIALGVGGNAAIFSLLNAVALRPLPVPDSGQLVSVYQIFQGKRSRSVMGEESMFSVEEYRTYRDTNHVFTGIVAYSPFLEATLGGETPHEYLGTYGSCNYFDLLGEAPAIGRGFLPSDCAAAGSGAVVVLSHDLWRDRFSSDPDFAGKAVILNGTPFTVVGVAQPAFHGTEAAYSYFWVPFTAEPVLAARNGAKVYGNANMSWLSLIGKLKPGEAMAHVRADLAVIAARIDRQYPGRSTTLAIDTATFASLPEARGIVMGVGAVILTAVAMVLLIVCANLANLLLARAVGRQKEIAIRLAVGATRAQLVRQLITESLLVALVGGAVGCAASFAAFGAILRSIQSHLPREVPQFHLQTGPDWRVLAYSLAITIVTGMGFGLVPALRATKIDLQGASKRPRGFLRGGLVGAQVAVCMTLLIAAGLLLHALYDAQNVDPGFQMKDTLTVAFHLDGMNYETARATEFQRQLLEAAAALPGVDAVAQARVTPLSDNHVGYGGLTPSGSTQERNAEVNVVSPGYFSMLHLPIVRGREFRNGETNAAIVTESTARRWWGGADAIGQTIRVDSSPISQVVVVGVARDAQISHLGRSNDTYVYFTASPEDQSHLQLLVHSRLNQQAAIRRLVHRLDPNLALDIAPLEDNLKWWRTPVSIAGALAGSLGALALLIALLGIYGVAAFMAGRRVREIGIRMALGADAAAVQQLILRQSMLPVLIGAVLGIAGCAAVSKVLSGILFGLSAYDPLAFVGVPILLIGCAALASHLPARRASRIDPVHALRHE